MEESLGLGLMAVCAVSGSMVLLVHHVHRHLFSDFMKKFEFEVASFLRPPDDAQQEHNLSEHRHEKKLRFCEVGSPETSSNGCRKVTEEGTREGMEMQRMVLAVEGVQKWRDGPRLEDIMPPNRAVLYKGIIKYRIRMGKFAF